jgi:hypothetical protein
MIACVASAATAAFADSAPIQAFPAIGFAHFSTETKHNTYWLRS